MTVVQACVVCGEEGVFVETPLISIGDPGGDPMIAGCQECKRLFCQRHAEGVPITNLSPERRQKYRKHMEQYGSVPRLLCCPLDLFVPLGVEAQVAQVLTNSGKSSGSQGPRGDARKVIDSIQRGLSRAQGKVCYECGEPVVVANTRMPILTSTIDRFTNPLPGFCAACQVFVCSEHARFKEIEPLTYVSGCPRCKGELET